MKMPAILKLSTDIADYSTILSSLISIFRIYQIEEDKEQGYEVSTHLSSLLSSLSSDQYCSLAVHILPLNHQMLELDTALTHCNDALLAELVLTFFRTGKLLLLFQNVLEKFNGGVVVGDYVRLAGETLAVRCVHCSFYIF